MAPRYWAEFVAINDLVGKSLTLNEQADLSGVGATLTILTAEQALDEATNFWPGIGVAGDGYFPMASCNSGSGDYYYINSNDPARSGRSRNFVRARSVNATHYA